MGNFEARLLAEEERADQRRQHTPARFLRLFDAEGAQVASFDLEQPDAVERAIERIRQGHVADPWRDLPTTPGPFTPSALDVLNGDIVDPALVPDLFGEDEDDPSVQHEGVYRDQ